MPLSGLIPVDTAVTVLKGPHVGKVGKVVGHAIVDLKPLNVVHISHDAGVHDVMFDGAELDQAQYNADVWRKECWTPPAA